MIKNKKATNRIRCLRLSIKWLKIHQTSVPFDGTWDYANIWGNSVIKINTEKNKDKLIDYIYNLSSADIKAQEKSDE